MEHVPTGAKHIHIGNQDSENTFSVAFKTVPTDSSGVAHILEHTVLCGSKKYPVRDPFFSMLKRSLSTFMNAFTASDWTMYPFSTQNKKDFYNLMDVYLDATFYPIIDRLSFKQEGHRLELEKNPATDRSELVYKGVVYNEMKGAMSSPDQVMVRSLLNAMYPDTTYSNNSGGDPAVIPTLTHEQLKQFHARHYHPSNAYFYTYGDLPLYEHVALIHDKVLQRYERIDPKTEVATQPRWQRPRKFSYTYPLDADQDFSRKSQVCVAWLTSDIKDSYQMLVLKLLEQILLGNSASPLRKALIDSELGSALSDGTGFDADNRDTLFACGLKDVSATDAAKIETIIFQVLNDLVEKGIDKELIESAIHQVEFHRKEITNTPYPYGIKLLLTFLGSWLHGGRPQNILRFESDLARLRHKIEVDGFFEKQIEKVLLKNPHKALFILKPDATMEKEERQRVRAELEDMQAQMGGGELSQIRKDTASLQKLQETPEDVSSLPTLALEDIPPTVQIVKASASYQSKAAVCYCQPTSGIFYATAALGINALQKKFLPFIPFFCYAVPKIGTKKHDFAEMAQKIDAYTGGINLSANARTRFDEAGDCLPFISVNGKCLVRNLEKMFDLLQEILFEVDFADKSRLKTLLMEYKAGLESMVVHNGHRYAISLASRAFSKAAMINEIWNGIHQLRFVKQLTDRLENDDLDALAADLTSIGRRILTAENLKLALVGEAQSLSRGISLISESVFLSGADREISEEQYLGIPKTDLPDEMPREGWRTPTAVSFVAKSFNTVRMNHEDAPRLSVISKMLRSLYLHREIREKGGAYGGFALYNVETGLFSLASYRDPHILQTLNVFDNAAGFITSGSITDEDVKEAILQVCSDIDRPDPPGPAAKKAFYRRMIAMTDESRLNFKRKLLALKRKDVLDTAEKYFHGHDRDQGIAVIAGEDPLQSANLKMPESPLKLFNI
jgi:Zn-dependent M16 (insulinase) family peptidase